MRVHAYAPTRIDLAGGTLDIWPLYLFHPNSLTVNVAINRYAHCVAEARRDPRIVLTSRDSQRREEYASLSALRARRGGRLELLAELVDYFRPQRGLSLTTWSEVPPGSGLGGSSALAVAVCAALTKLRQGVGGGGRRWHEWIALSRDLEGRVLGVPTGEQDHYPAVYGGVNVVRLEPGATRHEALALDPEALEQRLLLVYTGVPRRSGINNWEVLKRRLDGDPRVRRQLERIAAIARAMRGALARAQWPAVGRLLQREWETRRRLAPGISTRDIERLVRVGRRQGAVAAKVCGAGGGGCVVFVMPPGKRAAVATALAAAGATLLPFRVARRGVQVRRLA